jgi:hypothetical protein
MDVSTQDYMFNWFYTVRFGSLLLLLLLLNEMAGHGIP